MTEKNYLDIHVLISHSPSCLNRDDMNMQKSAVFGGVRRVRISSQSLKRAMRKSKYYEKHLGSPSDRTRSLDRLNKKYTEALLNKVEPALVTRTIALIAGKEGIADNEQADAVAPWSIAEVAALCEIVAAAERDGLNPKQIEKQVKQQAQSIRAALNQSVDIALSGRMATSGLMSSIDGAMAMAHAITTHAVDADIDWFTAVDDLVEDEGKIGAGHLNTQEFGAGVFYRYASLNIRQLQENLGGVARAQALEIAAHFVYLLSTVVPEAKQRSFAAFNPADLVLVSFADFPLSAANAFEKPIERDRKQGGFIKPSISALENYWQSVRTGYGVSNSQAVFSLWETTLTDRKATMDKLQEWVRAGGE